MGSQLNDEQVVRLNLFLKKKDEEIKNQTLLFLRKKLNAVITKTPEVRNKLRDLNSQLQTKQADLANLLNIQHYLGKCILEELEKKNTDVPKEEKKENR